MVVLNDAIFGIMKTVMSIWEHSFVTVDNGREMFQVKLDMTQDNGGIIYIIIDSLRSIAM